MCEKSWGNPLMFQNSKIRYLLFPDRVHTYNVARTLLSPHNCFTLISIFLQILLPIFGGIFYMGSFLQNIFHYIETKEDQVQGSCTI